MPMLGSRQPDVGRSTAVIENPTREGCQLATAFHPKFRLFWFHKHNSSQISSVKLAMENQVLEYLTKNNHDDLVNSSATSMDQEAEGDDFFSCVTKPKDQSHNQRSLKSIAQSLVKTWLDSPSKDNLTDAAFMGEQVFIDLFIKYNTAVPSSAAVERMFSLAKEIFRDKRVSLGDDSFDRLVFMKGNVHILNKIQISLE